MGIGSIELKPAWYNIMSIVLYALGGNLIRDERLTKNVPNRS